ncbi:hypothetical protein TNCV_2526991 [Trichonephila clavipes]|nr:hypothetical protein TNCV_2526991 [Trichonephila clavipes]
MSPGSACSNRKVAYVSEGSKESAGRLLHSRPHKYSASDVILFTSIGYMTRTSLVQIDGYLNVNPYISDTLHLVFVPYRRDLSNAFFRQDGVSAHDDDVTLLPHLVLQSPCHFRQSSGNALFHSGLSTPIRNNTLQLGEGGSCQIHIPETLIEIEIEDS